MKHKDDILQLLEKHKSLSNKELSEYCNLSLPTIRKLANELIDEGRAVHIYGGIRINDDALSNDYRAIAKAAVNLVNDGDSIFLGPGKTVATMCRYLKDFASLTVFTNSFYVIDELYAYPHITVVVIGGLFQRINKCFTLLDHIPDVNISKMFISCSGVDPKRGAYHELPSNRYTEEIFAKQASSIVLLADSSKFGVHKPFVLMPMDLIDCVVTTDDIDSAHELEEQGIKVIRVPK